MQYQWWLATERNIPWVGIEDIFTHEEIKKIIEIGKSEYNSTPTPAKIGYDKKIDESYRKCKLSWIRSDIEENEWIFQKIVDVITNINNQYFKFEINMIQNLQFTEYTSAGDFYGKHLDMGYEEASHRKISFSIQLSDEDEYTGGDLIIYFNDEGIIANKKKGFLTAFPSYALHEVIPVTNGKRYVLVGWICGPKFK